MKLWNSWYFGTGTGLTSKSRSKRKRPILFRFLIPRNPRKSQHFNHYDSTVASLEHVINIEKMLEKCPTTKSGNLNSIDEISHNFDVKNERLLQHLSNSFIRIKKTAELFWFEWPPTIMNPTHTFLPKIPIKRISVTFKGCELHLHILQILV